MSDRVAVVTGANRGLGFATARALAQKGYQVVLTARTKDKARKAAAKLALDDELEVIPAELDVSSDESVAAFFDGLRDNVGRIDVLVNNAGAIFEKGDDGTTPPTLEIPASVLADSLNTNSLGAYRTIRQALPMMNEAGYGRIVNVTSGMGGLNDMGSGNPAYRISKTALNAITRFMHHEAGDNVKINSVCPGWVKTDMGTQHATREIDEGITGILWAATLPDDGPNGGFFRDGEPVEW